jgi:hypothetical protein
LWPPTDISDGCELITTIEDDDWLKGGAWATYPHGQEQFGMVPYKIISDDGKKSLLKMSGQWWPAMPFKRGNLLMKGRGYFFDDQYKDELNCTKSSRREAKDAKYAKQTEFFWDEIRWYDFWENGGQGGIKDPSVIAGWEEYQKELYERCLEIAQENNLDGNLTLTAIIPYNDCVALVDVITGGKLKKDHSDVACDLPPAKYKDLLNVKKDSEFMYKFWKWDEVDEFTFRKEGSRRVDFKFNTEGWWLHSYRLTGIGNTFKVCCKSTVDDGYECNDHKWFSDMEECDNDYYIDEDKFKRPISYMEITYTLRNGVYHDERCTVSPIPRYPVRDTYMRVGGFFDYPKGKTRGDCPEEDEISIEKYHKIVDSALKKLLRKDPDSNLRY